MRFLPRENRRHNSSTIQSTWLWPLDALRSLVRWVGHSPTPAFEAEPTPEPLSSTAMQLTGSLPSVSAALRYTDGLGLNRGGSKSLSPLCTFTRPLLSLGERGGRREGVPYVDAPARAVVYVPTQPTYVRPQPSIATATTSNCSCWRTPTRVMPTHKNIYTPEYEVPGISK